MCRILLKTIVGFYSIFFVIYLWLRFFFIGLKFVQEIFWYLVCKKIKLQDRFLISIFSATIYAYGSDVYLIPLYACQYPNTFIQLVAYNILSGSKKKKKQTFHFRLFSLPTFSKSRTVT